MTEIATGPAAGDELGARRRALPVGAEVFAAAVAVGGLVRVWQIRGRGHLIWADSKDFIASARAPWASLALWAGPRTPAVPAMIKLVGGGGNYLLVQAVVAVLCWAALATAVGSAVGGRRARWLAAAAVVAFSVTAPVVMWERSVLSESLAVSLTALVVAGLVRLVERVTGWRVAAVLAALVVWLATRDTHAVVVAVGGAAVALALLVEELWWRLHRPGDGAEPPPRPARSTRRSLAALALGAVVLAGLSTWAANHGRRQAYPMRNVFEVRVLPYQDRVRWFRDHGMPQAGAFLGPHARPANREPGQAPVVYVPDDDAQLRPWLAWIGDGGRAAYARFVLTHPLYLVDEPLRAPERAFNNAHGDRSFYAPPDLRRVPLIDHLVPSTVVVLMVAAAVTGWAVGRRRASPLFVAGAVTAALAVPHGLAAWHSDGMETARHLVVPALQLHVGVLLLVIGALAAGRERGDGAEGGEPARLPSGHG